MTLPPRRPTSPDFAPGDDPPCTCIDPPRVRDAECPVHDDPTAGPWSLERVQAELSWRAGC